MGASFENNQTKSKESKESNGRGGARKNAGRKVGSATKRTREIADAAAASGEMTPLEYMLDVMRQDSDHADPKIQALREQMRFEAAKAAAPYVHPRLAAVEHTGAGGGPVEHSLTVGFVAAK